MTVPRRESRELGDCRADHAQTQRFRREIFTSDREISGGGSSVAREISDERHACSRPSAGTRFALD
jgi:hypothetical protein